MEPNAIPAKGSMQHYQEKEGYCCESALPKDGGSWQRQHSPWTGTELWMPSIFGNNMVLQRCLPVPVYGRAPAGTEVAVQFADQPEERVVSDSHGRWLVRLGPMDATLETGVLIMRTVGGQRVLSYTNVAVGDVWICAGQSNMEFMLKNATGGDVAIQEASAFPMIRCFHVEHGIAMVEQEDVGGSWHVSCAATVKTFSAVGYFFGRKLNQEGDVPIGLISTNWGGTRIEPWIPLDGFRSAPELKACTARLDACVAAAAAQTVPASPASSDRVPGSSPETGTLSYQDETALYNGMVAGLVPYGIRGVTWYQGESNASDGLKYWPKLRVLINSWRQKWAQKDFPIFFYVVQLANFSSTHALVREAQRRVLTLPNTGLASALDVGEIANVHPKNKKDVGERLAKWALRDVFRLDLVVSGPLATRAEPHDEIVGSVIIVFDHTGGGLMLGTRQESGIVHEASGKVTMCELAGEDRLFRRAQGEISENSLLISSADVPMPRFVRYACCANPDRKMLYNRAGLPASPFQLTVAAKT